ncbi:unannotated protein [freshwater metagenome]|uniref:Unannotated protein n=1 Tax=freshwater metagenome TaxID=449393 RepID=A0A6J7JRP3_9ZZZZ|nr:hypothetical protein [Actinomycetota bacterium]
MTSLLDGIGSQEQTTSKGQKISDQRRFFCACAIGGALGLIVFLLVIFLNHGKFFASSFVSGFYETQARSLRHLRFDVPPGSLGIEAFEIDGKSYMYFGPWPSLIRMPFMWLFPGMSGRWVNPSMLVALIVALIATSRLAWRIRGLVNEASPISRLECWVVGIFSFTVGGGSVFLFLTSQAWVYHEAELWGAAAALIVFDLILAFVLEPRAYRLVLASGFATMAVLSRPSVGFGPVFALGIIGVASLLPLSRRFFGLGKVFDPSKPLRWAWRAVLAAMVPAAIYVFVNYLKFNTILVFPSDKQIFSRVSAYREEMLAANGNSLFGSKFFLTALVQYLRPDGLQFSSLVPFINFPATAHVFGGVQFDTIEPTSSLTASMPFFACLAIVGVFAALWPGKGMPSRLASTRLLLLGALVGAYTVIPYSYIAQRYMSDFMPVLVIAGLVGAFVALRWAEQRQWRSSFILAPIAILAMFSFFANASLSWSYHYASPLVSEGYVTKYVDIQYTIHDSFPRGKAPYVVQGDRLPFPPLAKGTLFVLGDCKGVYYSQGNSWEPTDKWYAVARTRATGQYRFRVRFNRVSKTTIEPILLRGRAGKIQTVAAQVTKNNRVIFGLHSEGHENLRHSPRAKNGFFWGAPLKFKPGKPYDMVIVMDENNGAVSAVFDGYVGFGFQQFELTTPQSASYVFRTDRIVVGRNDVGAPTVPKFLGTLHERRIKYPALCKKLDLKTTTNQRSG